MTSIKVDHLQLIQGFNELYTHETLQSADLALNSRLRLIICLKCEIALPKTRVKKHGEKHGWSKEINAALTLFLKQNGTNLHTKYPLTAFPQPIPPYEGLPIVNNYFGCPTCGYAAQEQGTKAHINNTHGGNGTPKPNTSAQTYSVQNNQAWFQVISTDDTPTGIAIQGSQSGIQPAMINESESVSNVNSLVANLTLKIFENRHRDPSWMSTTEDQMELNRYATVFL